MKICVLGNGPIMLAMRRVSNIAIEEAELVETTAEANLVITESLKDVESNFSKYKHYVIVTVEKVKGDLPENVVVFQAPFQLSDFYKFISKISEKLADVEEKEMEVIPKVPLRPDAKRILVIDDTLQNIISAKRLLAGHKITVADSYERAMEILGKEKFDVVLSDLYLPMSSKTLSNEAFKLGELVPYGFLLALEAARNDARKVAIVTDLDHHSDHFSAAFDHFSQFVFRIDIAKVKMFHTRKTDDGAKDWKDALNRIMED